MEYDLVDGMDLTRHVQTPCPIAVPLTALPTFSPSLKYGFLRTLSSVYNGRHSSQCPCFLERSLLQTLLFLSGAMFPYWVSQNKTRYLYVTPYLP